MSRIPQQGSGLDRRTIAGEQQITSINVLSLLPRVVGDVPELVILSRGDRGAADFELDEGVFVWPDRGYRTGAGFTVLRVMGPNDGLIRI